MTEEKRSAMLNVGGIAIIQISVYLKMTARTIFLSACLLEEPRCAVPQCENVVGGIQAIVGASVGQLLIRCAGI